MTFFEEKVIYFYKITLFFAEKGTSPYKIMEFSTEKAGG